MYLLKGVIFKEKSGATPRSLTSRNRCLPDMYILQGISVPTVFKQISGATSESLTSKNQYVMQSLVNYLNSLSLFKYQV